MLRVQPQPARRLLAGDGGFTRGEALRHLGLHDGLHHLDPPLADFVALSLEEVQLLLSCKRKQDERSVSFANATVSCLALVFRNRLSTIY